MYHFTQHSKSEEERLAKLKGIMYSFSTRVPRVIMRRLEEQYPDLNLNVKTDNSGRSHALIREAANGNGGFKHARRRHDFSKHVKSKPEKFVKECRGSYKCQNTNSKFAKNDIEEHGHTRFKYSERYKCKFCKKSLIGTYIALHMKRHMGTLEHVCTVCGKQFPFKSNLSVHYERVHRL